MERYLKRAEEILNGMRSAVCNLPLLTIAEIAELRAEIEATENVINMSLDTQRNHLIRLNLQVWNEFFFVPLLSCHRNRFHSLQWHVVQAV